MTLPTQFCYSKLMFNVFLNFVNIYNVMTTLTSFLSQCSPGFMSFCNKHRPHRLSCYLAFRWCLQAHISAGTIQSYLFFTLIWMYTVLYGRVDVSTSMYIQLPTLFGITRLFIYTFLHPLVFYLLLLFPPTFSRHYSKPWNHRTNSSNPIFSWVFSPTKSLC